LGRPTVPAEIRRLIREMSMANPLWGAPALIMGHGRRRILWLGITAHPTAEWIANGTKLTAISSVIWIGSEIFVGRINGHS
jgi:hypothetical protein